MEQVKKYFMLFLLVGVGFGVICSLANIIFNAGFIQVQFEQYISSCFSAISEQKIIWYIGKIRIIQVLFVIFFSGCLPYRTIINAIALIAGWFYGMFFCLLFLQYGFRGIVYNTFCFFPHFLFYGIALFCWGKYILIKTKLEKTVKKTQYFFIISVIIFMIFLGLIWEIKYQKNILKFFYQYLVP